MPSVDISGNRISITAQYQDRDTIKEVPGSRWDAQSKKWSVPLSWGSCIVLRNQFGSNLSIGPDLVEWAKDERANRVDYISQIRDTIEPTPEMGQRTGTEHDQLLRPFQLVGRDFLVYSEQSLLADEMGTGKTIQTLAAIRQTQALPALVVCPNSVKHHWYRETSKWLPESTPYVVSGSAAQRRKILAQAQEDPTAFVIINIESVRLHSRLSGYGSIRLSRCTECDPDYGDGNLTEAKCEVHPKELNQISFLTCVLDEAHRVKDPKAKQTRAIWSIFHAPSVKYAWALTGTPITKHPGDLWSTMHAVAPQDFPVKSKFIDRYAKTSFNPFGGMDIIGLKKESADELFAFLDSRFRRITKDRVLTDLPPKVYTTHTVEMSPKQKKAYDQLESQFATRLEDGSLLIARSHLSARTRLMQLASSYCEIDYGDDPTDIDQWTVIPTTPSSKIDALVFLVEDLHSQGKPAAVAAEHRQLIELAEQQLTKSGYQCVMITGDVPANVRSANLQQFQNGDANVILFTYKAGGVGLDMSTADTLIKLQLSWSMVDNLQGEDRIHRIGSEQHQSINIVHITTEGTIEEDQISSYEQKIERLEEITRDRKRREEAGLDTQRNDDEMTKIKAETLGE